MISIILVGRQIVAAYENSINLELEAKLLEFKASEAEIWKRAGFNASGRTSGDQ